jgi:predicted nucleic-acid-binding Zn-ribbon protein
MATANLITVNGRQFTCPVCDGREFYDRQIKLNTGVAEYFDMGWANQSALGVVCAACGHIDEFVGSAVELWKVDGGYPAPES